MRILLLVVFYFLPAGCFLLPAQTNLVYNGSFEIYDSCPIQNSLSPPMEIEKARGWFSASLHSPDFFHECNNTINGVVGVPSNLFGYQQAHEGQGYAGFGAFDGTKSQEREFIESELTSRLQAGATYEVSFYVSLCNYSNYAISKIGVYFSENKLFYNGMDYIPVIPQIKNTPGLFLNDTVSWMQVKATFQASGNEQYITIGYFEPAIENDTQFIQPPVFFPDPFAYYYIDMISVKQISMGQILNVFTPDNDGINDYFDFSGYNLQEIRIEIFNRWGVKVLSSNDNKFKWNGKNIDGVLCPDGVYYYILTGKFETEGKAIKYKGFIHLIRQL